MTHLSGWVSLLIDYQAPMNPRLSVGLAPDWMGVYKPRNLTTNANEFRFYASRNEEAQPVTLLMPSNGGDQLPTIKMYYNVEKLKRMDRRGDPDQTPLKDFSHLSQQEKLEVQRINVSNEDVVGNSSWVRKYEPRMFIDLLTDEMHNRNVLTWLKSWDPVVFKKHKASQSIPTLFKKSQFKNNTGGYGHQEYTYKKLILLAGPPGCGKTTLARVVARHCGYHWEEINASDDRSGKTLINKIDNLVTNQTIRAQKKPVCLIIDEVDGALDSDANGIKEVLNYIETGHTGEGNKEKDKEKDKGKDKNKEKEMEKPNENKDKGRRGYSKHNRIKLLNDTREVKPTTAPQQKEEKRRNGLDRPVIFICNDPYVRGLRQLRNRAIVVYFNTLQEDKLVKRLKQILDHEEVYLETDVLMKICKMCNNDVRSSLGLLDLAVRLKKSMGIPIKTVINRMKLSFVKDVQSSTNSFLAKITSKREDKVPLKDLQHELEQHPNHSLLNDTFFYNLTHHKYLFNKFNETTRLYRLISQADAYNRQMFGLRGDNDAELLPFVYYRMHFRSDDNRKPEFPSLMFERKTKQKSNEALLEKIHKQFPDWAKPFTSSQTLLLSYLPLLWVSMQTASPKEQEVLLCVYKMLTYGFSLASRGNSNLFVPQLDQLLTFGQRKPEITLSNTSRNLIQENFEFLKLKGNLLAEVSESRNSYEKVISQLKKNRRKKRQSQQGQVKYKFLEGTGTEVKYDLKMSYFFNEIHRNQA